MLTRSLTRRHLRPTALYSFSSDSSADFIGDWMKKVSSKVSTARGKSTVGQLSGLMTHYNKAPAAEEPGIDWADWESRIKTANFVSDLKDKFEFLDHQSYQKEGIMEAVTSSSSDAYSNMNNELQLHNDLWFEFYMSNRRQENDVADVGNLKDYHPQQLHDMFPQNKAKGDKLVETYNILSGTHDDVDYYGYLHIQFNWGKKQTSFYRHPNDDFRSLRATKNIIGQ